MLRAVGAAGVVDDGVAVGHRNLLLAVGLERQLGVDEHGGQALEAHALAAVDLVLEEALVQREGEGRVGVVVRRDGKGLQVLPRVRVGSTLVLGLVVVRVARDEHDLPPGDHVLDGELDLLAHVGVRDEGHVDVQVTLRERGELLVARLLRLQLHVVVLELLLRLPGLLCGLLGGVLLLVELRFLLGALGLALLGRRLALRGRLLRLLRTLGVPARLEVRGRLGRRVAGALLVVVVRVVLVGPALVARSGVLLVRALALGLQALGDRVVLVGVALVGVGGTGLLVQVHVLVQRLLDGQRVVDRGLAVHLHGRAVDLGRVLRVVHGLRALRGAPGLAARRVRLVAHALDRQQPPVAAEDHGEGVAGAVDNAAAHGAGLETERAEQQDEHRCARVAVDGAVLVVEGRLRRRPGVEPALHLRKHPAHGTARVVAALLLHALHGLRERRGRRARVLLARSAALGKHLGRDPVDVQVGGLVGLLGHRRHLLAAEGGAGVDADAALAHRDRVRVEVGVGGAAGGLLGAVCGGAVERVLARQLLRAAVVVDVHRLLAALLLLAAAAALLALLVAEDAVVVLAIVVVVAAALVAAKIDLLVLVEHLVHLLRRRAVLLALVHHLPLELLLGDLVLAVELVGEVDPLPHGLRVHHALALVLLDLRAHQDHVLHVDAELVPVRPLLLRAQLVVGGVGVLEDELLCLAAQRGGLRRDGRRALHAVAVAHVVEGVAVGPLGERAVLQGAGKPHAHDLVVARGAAAAIGVGRADLGRRKLLEAVKGRLVVLEHALDAADLLPDLVAATDAVARVVEVDADLEEVLRVAAVEHVDADDQVVLERKLEALQVLVVGARLVLAVDDGDARLVAGDLALGEGRRQLLDVLLDVLDLVGAEDLAHKRQAVLLAQRPELADPRLGGGLHRDHVAPQDGLLGKGALVRVGGELLVHELDALVREHVEAHERRGALAQQLGPRAARDDRYARLGHGRRPRGADVVGEGVAELDHDVVEGELAPRGAVGVDIVRLVTLVAQNEGEGAVVDGLLLHHLLVLALALAARHRALGREVVHHLGLRRAHHPGVLDRAGVGVVVAGPAHVPVELLQARDRHAPKFAQVALLQLLTGDVAADQALLLPGVLLRGLEDEHASAGGRVERVLVKVGVLLLQFGEDLAARLVGVVDELRDAGDGLAAARLRRKDAGVQPLQVLLPLAGRRVHARPERLDDVVVRRRGEGVLVLRLQALVLLRLVLAPRRDVGDHLLEHRARVQLHVRRRLGLPRVQLLVEHRGDGLLLDELPPLLQGRGVLLHGLRGSVVDLRLVLQDLAANGLVADRPLHDVVVLGLGARLASVEVVRLLLPQLLRQLQRLDEGRLVHLGKVHARLAHLHLQWLRIRRRRRRRLALGRSLALGRLLGPRHHVPG